MAGERSRAARAFAEEALVRLTLAAGADARRFVVIGGLTPDLLTDPVEASHIGTVDVDLALELELVFDRDEQDFGWLERAFDTAGFRRVNPDRGWRWQIDVAGVPVVVDVLCDVPDNLEQEIALPGTTQVTAQNLLGPGAALDDAREQVLIVPSWIDHSAGEIRIRFAGLAG